MSDSEAYEERNMAAERDQSDQTGVSRRKALGRMVAYTAPVMLALLASKQHAAASGV
jgi:hypothetical protein